MCITGNEMDQAIAQQAFGPRPHTSAEYAIKRSCGNLHPHAAADEFSNQIIMRCETRQPFRMGQDWNISSSDQTQQKVIQTWRQQRVRRLDQDIARAVERRHITRPQPLDEIRLDMHIRAGNQPQRNSFPGNDILEAHDSASNGGAGVVVKSRQNMRCTHDDCHAICGQQPRHAQRDRDIRGAIIDGRQYVAMQINHSERTERLQRSNLLRSLLHRTSRPHPRTAVTRRKTNHSWIT